MTCKGKLKEPSSPASHLRQISNELIRNWVSNCAVTSNRLAACYDVALEGVSWELWTEITPAFSDNLSANWGCCEQVVPQVTCLQKFEYVTVGVR